MQLSHLIRELQATRVVGPIDRPISDVAYDSRRVEAGDVFVAIAGARCDGATFIHQAIARGAVAIVTERDTPFDLEIPADRTLITVPDGRRALALMAAARWEHPSRRLGVVGVTGTDGKTTTSTLIADLFDASGERSGLWSTVEIRGSERKPNHTDRTTPESTELQAHLADVASTGARWAVLELSSHGLALERATGCDLDVAVMTNLSPEHLDFHGTFESYRSAKARLFESIPAVVGAQARRVGIINADDPSAQHFAQACRVDVLTYGLERRADVVARDVTLGLDRTSFVVDSPIGTHRVSTRLVGRFNVYNWLAAITVAISQGLDWDVIDRAADSIAPIRGRAHEVHAGQPFTVLVDFAHTPRALASVLSDCRSLSTGRVIVVVGHPGERYALNRPRLGAAAVAGADLAIITSDDSYGEEPAGIIGAIAEGARSAGGSEGRDYVVIPDRREAIGAAVRAAQSGDIVLIAGRGHLSYQAIGARRIPFDDARVARDLLCEPGVDRSQANHRDSLFGAQDDGGQSAQRLGGREQRRPAAANASRWSPVQ
ncbi:MAG: UDP-N-acetylmuramoyl-L-alanyl-D-glutamate--2,6-diaminopimelate ligase [Chloroflexota bacterium]